MESEQKQTIATVTNSKRALFLVEDYVPCQKIMSHYLQQGYEVELAADGITTIQRAHNKVYDLIVEDLDLSSVTGKKVIQNVRSIAGIRWKDIIGVYQKL